MRDDILDNGSSIQIYREIKLGLHADVAHWNANAGFEDLLVVGTYELDESVQQRLGTLYTFRVSENLDVVSEGEGMDLPGIFDLRWVPGSLKGSETSVVCALADGTLTFLNPISKTVHEDISSSTCDGYDELCSDQSGPMALTVDCYRDESSLCTTSSYSDGTVHVHRLTDTSIERTRSWQAHSLEAWVSQWSLFGNGNIIYSGGDDAKFCGWDIRELGLAPGSSSLVFSDHKTHGAGVCCIAELSNEPQYILTGSYDEKIRLWDARAGSKPVCAQSVDTGGGVWRVQPHPRDPTLLIAACMHHGFWVCRVDPKDGSVKLVERYPHQQTLAYGAAWSHQPPTATNGKAVVATCSFYDNLLHIWSPSIQM